MSDEMKALAERLYGYGSDDGVAACAAILSLLEERDEARHLYQTHARQTKYASDAMASRLEKAKEALRTATAELDEALSHLHWLCRGGEFAHAMENDTPISRGGGKEYAAAVEWMSERNVGRQYVHNLRLREARTVLSDLERDDEQVAAD